MMCRPDPLAPYARGRVYDAVRGFALLCVGIGYAALGLAALLVLVVTVAQAF